MARVGTRFSTCLSPTSRRQVSNARRNRLKLLRQEQRRVVAILDGEQRLILTPPALRAHLVLPAPSSLVLTAPLTFQPPIPPRANLSKMKYAALAAAVAAVSLPETAAFSAPGALPLRAGQLSAAKVSEHFCQLRCACCACRGRSRGVTTQRSRSGASSPDICWHGPCPF